jgi:hypothetical protein
MIDINQRSRKPLRGALEAADLSDLISPAVKYSRDRTSAFLGLFGGSGRADFFFDAAEVVFLSTVLGSFDGAADFLTADFVFFDAVLGMFAENDHWGKEKQHS